MKNLIIILFCLLSLNTFSQTQDTVRVPQAELDEIISVIDTLVTQDSINNILIGQQDFQINNFMLLAKQDSLIIDFKNQEIILLNDRINIYADQMKRDQKWYNKRQFGFIIGVLSTVGIIHFIDYTLP
jgi:hypothetical protein